jgi:hypothetical protein
MSRRLQWCAALAAAGTLAVAGPGAAWSQVGPGLTLPPDGGNQRATVIQGMGLVRVSIDYSSPHVHSPAGEDRRGKIWGDKNVVPYGMATQGVGACGPKCPWRGGANENTVFTTNHDIKVQGQALPAGSYGLFFSPGPDEWTIIFSKTSTSWGSFFYDPKEDALRVTAKPEKGSYHEDLTYWFRDSKLEHATAVLSWEDLDLPFAITVDDTDDLYIENIRRELRNSPGFTWQGYNAAAQFCLQRKTHLEDGLHWAEQAAGPGVGQANFTTLMTLANLQEATGKTEEAGKTRDKALHDSTATALDLHIAGRALLAQKKNAEALQVFELNAKLHPDSWVVHVGLGRGYAAQGRRKEAIAEFKRALAMGPDELNRASLEDLIKKLEAGKDI